MIRILSVVDAFTRECLALEADTSLGSGRVTRALDRLIEERGLPSTHVVLHDRVAARVAVLGAESLEDPLGRVPLLARPMLVVFENRVDHAMPGSSLGRRTGFCR